MQCKILDSYSEASEDCLLLE